MIPTEYGRQYWQVTSFEFVHTRPENIGNFALVDKHSCLALANCQFSAILDFVAISLKAIDHRVVGIVRPFNYIDEFAEQFVK